MKKYHVHVVKITSEHEFNIIARDVESARKKALGKTLTKKNQVLPGNPKMAVTFD